MYNCVCISLFHVSSSRFVRTTRVTVYSSFHSTGLHDRAYLTAAAVYNQSRPNDFCRCFSQTERKWALSLSLLTASLSSLALRFFFFFLCVLRFFFFVFCVFCMSCLVSCSVEALWYFELNLERFADNTAGIALSVVKCRPVRWAQRRAPTFNRLHVRHGGATLIQSLCKRNRLDQPPPVYVTIMCLHKRCCWSFSPPSLSFLPACVNGKVWIARERCQHLKGVRGDGDMVEITGRMFSIGVPTLLQEAWMQTWRACPAVAVAVRAALRSLHLS